MTDLPEGHLAFVDGDLDDLTVGEARNIPACDATDCAVMWVMGAVISPYYLSRSVDGRNSILIAHQSTNPHVQAQGELKRTVQPSARVSRSGDAAKDAREWLASTLEEEDKPACTSLNTAPASCVIRLCKGYDEDGFPKELTFAMADNENLATARLILVSYAKGLLS